MIESYTFGNIVVNGKSYKDIKIYKGNISPWIFTENHTLTKEDIKEIIEDIDVLVVGTGASGLIKVKPEVIEIAKNKNIQLIIQPTARAVQEFNLLERNNKKVAGIFHSTC